MSIENQQDANTITLATANGRDVVMDHESFEALEDQHRGSLFWNDNGRGYAYVRVARGSVIAGQQAHPYAARRSRAKHNAYTTLARVIAGAGFGQTVRHVNGNRADLRRVNLRVCGTAPTVN